jgi:hypothetical protein
MTPDQRSAAELYIATWAPSTDEYVHWSPGAGHAVTVHEPPTPEVIFRADQPVSFRHPAADGRTHILAVDVDVEGDDGWQAVLAIGRAFIDSEVPALVSHSRRGGHVWVRVDGRVSAGTAYRACRAAIRRAGHDPDDPKFETRPASERGGRTNLRAPLMCHPLTGQRYPLLDPSTEQPVHRMTLRDKLLQTCTIEASVRAVEHLASLDAAGAPWTAAAPRTDGDGPIDRFNAQVGVCAVLRQDYGVERAAPGRSVRCPFHDDRTASLSIAKDDQRVFCKSPSCVIYADGRGVDAWDLAERRKGAAA